jgi:hypothetical protein
MKRPQKKSPPQAYTPAFQQVDTGAEQKHRGNTVQNEDAPAMSAGSGAVAGIGVGPQGEPGISQSTVLKRKKFAGMDVFEVNSDWFHKARFGKRKHARYEHYVGTDAIGEAIRAYANEDYTRPIIIQDERTGAMCYLRYGKK